MAITVQAPNGDTIDFPDGTPPETITQVMAKQYPPTDGPSLDGTHMVGASPDNSVEVYVDGNAPDKPTSQALGFWKGLTTPLDNAAVAVEAGMRKVGVPVDAINEAYGKIPVIGTDKSAAQIRDERNAAIENSDHRPGTAGEIAGSIVGTAPIAIENPWLGGAAVGALTSDKKDLKGVAEDAIISALLGKTGQVAMKGAGAVVAPKVNDLTKYLLDRGIRLTPGQILGGGWHRVEDAVGTIPFLGDLVNAAQGRATEDMNRAAVNEALKHIGEKAPKDLTGHELAAYVQDRLGKAYDSVVPSLSAVTDGKFLNNLYQIISDAHGNLGADELNVLKGAMQRVAGAFKPHPTGSPMPTVPGGFKGPNAATGQDFKDLEGWLSQQVRNIRSNPNSTMYHHNLADHLDDMRSELRDLLARNNPAVAKVLQDINKAYAKFVPVEGAIGGTSAGKAGVFTGSDLGRAANKGVSRSAKARGGNSQRQLAEASQQVQGRSVGDSGTATRGLVTYGLGALLSGHLPAGMTINPMLAAGLGGIMSMYTKTGQKVAETLLTKRPAQAAAVRTVINKAAPVAARALPAAHAGERNNRNRATQ